MNLLKKQDPAKWFWTQVEKGTDPNGCWLWVGKSIKKGGYGSAWWPETGRTEGSNRCAWMVKFGPIPAGKHVLHACDRPPCCNPAHLFLGDYRTNNQDKLIKGRQARGPEHSLRLKAYYAAHPEKKKVGQTPPKITLEQAEEIKWLYEQGATQRRLAKEYGISQGGISLIVTGKRWPQAA